MTILSDEWLQRLGPAVLPFERKQFRSRIEEGEDIIFLDAIISVADRSTINPKTLPVSTIENDLPMLGKYLWVIDKHGLKIIPESTPNPYASRKVVCHTNMTGGAAALQGGKLWFGDDGKTYLNFKSGRYGAGIGTQAIPHKLAVMDFFRSINFNPVELESGF